MKTGSEGGALRVVYMVSRFPNVSETFVLRELNEVAATAGVEAELASLFPPPTRSFTPRPGAGSRACIAPARRSPRPP